MPRALGTVLAAALVSSLAGVLLVPGAVGAEEPDTTAPRVLLDPCPEVPLDEACSRREVAWVGQEVVDPDEGLAVAGVRIGDMVLTEHVYDDGSGFTPYGPWVPPTTDVGSQYDYLTEASLDEPGPHELTFYARDLAGNEATLTRTVEGPTVPDRPSAFEVRPSRAWTRVTWTVDARGSGIRHYWVRVKGQPPFEASSSSFSPTWGINVGFVDLPLDRGRHVLRVKAVNVVGEGQAGRVVFRVPR